MKTPLLPDRPMLRAVKHGSLRLTRWIAWGLGITACLVIAAFLLLRYVVLPSINDYREQIAEAISRAAGQRVSIGAVEGRFDGLHPRLALRDVRVYDAGGVARLALDAVDGWLSWTSLPAGEPRFQAIELQRLNFEVRRDAQRRWWIAGMPLQQETGKGGFGDWLLEQQRVTVRDSSVTWIDETLGGTPLPLQETTLQIEKRLRAWHFALRSVPPEEIAGPIDLRGDLSREDRGAEAKWSGKLYFRLGYADLATLRQWLAIPFDISQGAGTIEAWSQIDASRLNQLSADVALSDVNLRLRPSLPELALSRMSGRLSWEEKADGVTYAARQLSFTTPDGLQMAPADISYHRQGEENTLTARSQLMFDRLDLVAMTRLLDRLPLDDQLRQRIAEAAPHGLLRDFDLRWVGPFQERSSYQLHTGFEQLGLSPSGYLPGFSAVSGRLEATDQGGAVTLRASRSEVDMPLVFAAPLPLETLDARVTWSGPITRPLVRIERASFANAHLTGQISGSYRVVPGHPGTMDLNGTLTRGDAREVWRYIPLNIHERVRSWLKDALVAGHSEDVRFRLRGDLRHFPFVNPNHGIFEVVTRFHDGSLAFAPGWPVIEGISGELVFRAASMTVNASQGRVYGTTLRDVTASIPDLSNRDQMLHVHGVAEGPSQDFLRYIEGSEVDHWIGGFTRGMRATGNGTLTLALVLPVHRMHQTTVRGGFRFAGNVLEPGHGAPRLEQLNGELRFSERDVHIRDATARVLGMPTRFSAQREGGRVSIRGRGRADTAALRQLVDHPAAGSLSGAVDWQAAVSIGEGSYDLRVDSDLRGLTSVLPAPLAKDAAQAWPLRYERRGAGATHELTVLSLGSLLSAQLLSERNAPARILRGEVRLNAAAPAPSRDGLWLAGTVPHADYDRWHAIFDTGGSGSDRTPLSGISLHAGTVRAYGRDWNDLKIALTRDRDVWRGRIDAREIAGTLQWQPADRGALFARLTRLHVPESKAEVTSLTAGQPAVTSLPALDLTAEDFRLGEREFGSLTLMAGTQGSDWRIRQLETASAQGTLRASGVWRVSARRPLTSLDVALEASDIGAYLTRLRLPPGVVGGNGRVHGRLSWIGAPQTPDPPSLSGALQLQAQAGRFAKVEQGIGKLIGVISLQALPRRVALDFRDVFSEGFAFDLISADIAIDQGVARTANFNMIGPSARVEMSGEVNLVGETQLLEVKVLPALSESLALGAAFFNPAVGIATLLAQKALKDPINQLAAFDYEVSGTWDDPMVLKKRHDNGDPVRPGRQ